MKKYLYLQPRKTHLEIGREGREFNEIIIWRPRQVGVRWLERPDTECREGREFNEIIIWRPRQVGVRWLERPDTECREGREFNEIIIWRDSSDG